MGDLINIICSTIVFIILFIPLSIKTIDIVKINNTTKVKKSNQSLKEKFPKLFVIENYKYEIVNSYCCYFIKVTYTPTGDVFNLRTIPTPLKEILNENEITILVKFIKDHYNEVKSVKIDEKYK